MKVLDLLTTPEWWAIVGALASVLGVVVHFSIRFAVQSIIRDLNRLESRTDDAHDRITRHIESFHTVRQ